MKNNNKLGLPIVATLITLVVIIYGVQYLFAWSIAHGKTSIVKASLAIGMSPNSDYAGGVPVLHIAAVRGHVDIVALLIEHGAEINAVNTQMRTVIEDIDDEVFFQKGLTALHAAAQGGDVDTIKLLISLGADVNGKGECHEPPIVNAVAKANVGAVKILLKHGADPFARTSVDTPLTSIAGMSYKPELRQPILEAMERVRKEKGKDFKEREDYDDYIKASDLFKR